MKPNQTELKNLILNHQLDLALSQLNEWTPEGRVDERIKLHFQALVQIQKGEFQSARRVLIDARARFGDNLGLLRELMICHYHLQEMDEFRELFNELEDLWIKLRPQLSDQTCFEVAIALGKICEEEARLAPAQIYYDEALLYAHSAVQRVRVLVQKGRWLALHDPNEKLGAIYRELISMPKTRLSEDLTIEREHSLMMIEMQLIGRNHAWMRIERLLSELDATDARLMVFDFLELSLAKGDPIAPSVLKLAGEFKDLDPFEQFIRDHLHDSLEENQRLSKLADLASQISWSCHLRLLCLSANSATDKSLKDGYLKNIDLVLSALDEKSQFIWKQQLNEILQSPETAVELNVGKSEVVISGKLIELKKKKSAAILLEALAQNAILSVDDAIKNLWGCDFSPEHYHRLRMTIHRLNTLVNEQTGTGKIIEVDAEKVQIRSGVRLSLNGMVRGAENQKRRCEASVLQQGVLPSIAPPHN